MDRLRTQTPLSRPLRVVSSADGRARDSLLLMARLKTAGQSEPLTVRIRNLSEGGLMAELPFDLPCDASVEIEVRGIGWVAGRVAWQTQGRAGIAFDVPIDPRRARKPYGSRERG